MTKTKCISLSDGIYERLGQEKNASGLIDSLLQAHYMQGETKEELQELLKKKKMEESLIVTVKQKEIQKIEEQVKKAETAEHNEQKKAETAEELLNKRKERIQKNFLKEIGRELTEDELTDYITKLDAGTTDIFLYAEELNQNTWIDKNL